MAYWDASDLFQARPMPKSADIIGYDGKSL